MALIKEVHMVSELARMFYRSIILVILLIIVGNVVEVPVYMMFGFLVAGMAGIIFSEG